MSAEMVGMIDHSHGTSEIHGVCKQAKPAVLQSPAYKIASAAMRHGSQLAAHHISMYH